MKTISILIPYFGKFPEWFPLFFETLKRNSTINFIFYTDCDESNFSAPNVKFKKMSFSEYLDFVSQKLGFEFKTSYAYKLCDLRPFYAQIHYDDIKDYDFYGWTDLDLFFGDIRSFYTDDLLNKFDVFSTHGKRLSGHFSLFRNTIKNRMMYKRIYRRKEYLLEKEYMRLDENGLTNAYVMTIFDKINEKFNLSLNNFFTKLFSSRLKKYLYMKEQYTTPFTPIPWLDGSINSNQPDIWYYIDGKITNNRDGEREFMYLHFMNFKSSQWRHDGTKAPWEGNTKISYAKVSDMNKGIIISEKGILPI